MFITTLYAFFPDSAWMQFEKVIKIQLMTFVTLILMCKRDRVEKLIWIIVLSLGFYGVKGGLFTLTTGGVYHVRGPLGTFIGGNNEIGLALIMILPLMRYLQLRTEKAWMRIGWYGAILLTGIAILGTQSRGAFLGIIVMSLFLILKSRKRFVLLIVAGLMVPIAITVMPESWQERMHTIETYEEDASAQGRIRAWKKGIDIADISITGGGFEAYLGGTDAHSIYFEVLGEHGYIGLSLFLMLGLFTWRTGSKLLRETKNIEDLRWARDLVAMLQVSIVGYASAGAFLGLAYFDLYYHIVALMILCKVIVAKELARVKKEDDGMFDDAAIKARKYGEVLQPISHFGENN
jgi:probable O-glycosylation ligase (exosortase A-associated)